MGSGELGILVLAVIALLALVWWSLHQMEARLHARITEQGTANKALIDALSSTQVSERAQLTEIREQLDELRESLPNQYMRREDWIRMSAVIDGKLDRINTEQRALALLLAKGAKP